jgi:hypothetical protein
MSVSGPMCSFYIDIHSHSTTSLPSSSPGWKILEIPLGEKSVFLAALVLLNHKIFPLTHFLLPHRLRTQVPIMAYNKAVDKFRDIEYPMMQGLHLPSVFSEKIR